METLATVLVVVLAMLAFYWLQNRINARLMKTQRNTLLYYMERREDQLLEEIHRLRDEEDAS